MSGETRVPGDKSISHRAAILGSIAEGTTRIKSFADGDDCNQTLKAFRLMGMRIGRRRESSTVEIYGRGLHGLREPDGIIDVGNSGTSIRLLTGLLSAQPFFSVLSGDSSVRSRPMKRVVEPLRKMGAQIGGREQSNKAPLAIQGSSLTGINYDSPIPSAQVKSALLLAGLYAQGHTEIREPLPSRDHTERMLEVFGARIEAEKGATRISRTEGLKAQEIDVPGDLSSAAFFLVAGLITKDSEVNIKGVGINQTRNGIIEILKQMGGDLRLDNVQEISGEPRADITVRSSKLRGVKIDGELVVRSIDELPIICGAAALAEGETIIQGAGELRVKETDRIRAMANELIRFGVKAEEYPEGIRIIGMQRLKGSTCFSYGDHRIAMTLAILGLVTEGKTIVVDTSCIKSSFPGFWEVLDKLAG
ncbi:MAG: 3-phosphoshikimate 1-carboxyvinyltransferase [Deltaproteobacteria bacterium]|nr:MAG: 3-phosphoshikimate 1-carboxyvinyltransferase [Deltaproteobacteria bacterium]